MDFVQALQEIVLNRVDETVSNREISSVIVAELCQAKSLGDYELLCNIAIHYRPYNEISFPNFCKDILEAIYIEGKQETGISFLVFSNGKIELNQGLEGITSALPCTVAIKSNNNSNLWVYRFDPSV